MITEESENTQLSNNNLPLFKSELTDGKELRIFGNYETPLFVAKDIAQILGYTNSMKAIRDHVDIEDKITFNKVKDLGGIFVLPEIFKVIPS